MTTTVIVQAHCADTKEVIITVEELGNRVEEFTLQDGEEKELVVYDNRVATIIEIEKD